MSANLTTTILRPRVRSAWLAFAVFGWYWGSWSALVPTVEARAHTGVGGLGIAMLAGACGGLPASIMAGSLVRRLGHHALTITLALYAVLGLAPLAAHSLPVLVLAMVGTAGISSSVNMVMNAALSAGEQHTGRRFMGRAHATFSLAVMLGSATTGALLSAGVPMVAILGAACLAIAVSAWLSWSVGSRAMAADVEPAPAPRGRGWRHAVGAAISRRMLASRLLIAIGLVASLGVVVEDGVQSWASVMLHGTLHGSYVIAGLGPACFAGAMVVCRLCCDSLTVRIGESRLLLLAGLTCGTGAALVALAPVPLVALVGFAVAGAGVGPLSPAFFGMAGRLAPAGDEVRGITTVTTIGYFGAFLGPAVVGAVAHASGLRVAYAGIAAVGIAFGLLSTRLPIERSLKHQRAATVAGTGQIPVISGA